MTDIANGASTMTRLGLNLIAKWGAGAPRVIDSVWVGSGRADDTMALTEFTDLITPVAQATSTVPQTVDSQVQFVLEYRNELEPGLAGFWLNEYGVFAIDHIFDPSDNSWEPGERVLVCYGTLGDFPDWVPPHSSGILSIRHYPISIGVSGTGEVILSYPANAFMTAQEVADFFNNASANMIELSDVEVPNVGTKTHYRITAGAPNYRPFGWVDPELPPTEPPVDPGNN